MDRVNASLGLPEVVELEVKAHTIVKAKELVENAKGTIAHLGRLLGRGLQVALPDPEGIAGAIEDRIRELNPMIERIPLSLAQTRKALARIINGLASSNSKHEELRDAAIWEAVIEKAQSRRALFLTCDKKAFYDEGNVKKGLALPLLEEVTNSNLHVELLSDIV